MTRGKFILICEDKVLESRNFNGDMYPSGYGEDAMKILCKITDENQFENMVAEFNSDHHQYDDRELVFVCDFFTGKYTVNFNISYSERFFSDYLFIKNISNVTISAIDRDKRKFKILPDQTICLDFGSIITDLEDSARLIAAMAAA